MKFLLLISNIFVLLAVPALGQLMVDAEKPTLLGVSREGENGKTFQVSARLDPADAGAAASTTADDPASRRLFCSAVGKTANKSDRTFFVEAGQPDRSKANFNCAFEWSKVKDIDVLNIKFTFATNENAVTTLHSITAAPTRNSITVQSSVFGPAVWYDDEDSIRVPVTSNQNVKVTFSLDCPTANPSGQWGRADVLLTPETKEVRIKPNAGIVDDLNCTISLAKYPDDLAGIVDFRFLNGNSQNLVPLPFTIGRSQHLAIDKAQSTGIKNGFVAVNSFNDQNILVVTTLRSDLRMLLDGQEKQLLTNTNNHNFVLSKNVIKELDESKQHTLTFTDGRSLNLSVPLMLNINTKLNSSKVYLDDQKKLHIDFDLSKDVNAFLLFPELTDFQRLDSPTVNCVQGKCTTALAAATTTFITSVTNALSNSGTNKKEFTIEIRAVDKPDEVISKLRFDAVKTGLDPAKVTALQQEIEKDKNFDQNKSTYVNKLQAELCGDSCTQSETDAVNYIVERLKKEKSSTNKFVSILRFGAKVALTYFGIPLPQ